MARSLADTVEDKFNRRRERTEECAWRKREPVHERVVPRSDYRIRIVNLEENQRVAFGVFEVDLKSREVWKSGHRVKLQDQPFRLLATLLKKPGQVVTHSELQFQVWGPDTNVDLDRALAVAIKKIREALSDSAENPIFVETLARRGYRFIAPVTVTSDSSPLLPANGTQVDGAPPEIFHQATLPLAEPVSVAQVPNGPITIQNPKQENRQDHRVMEDTGRKRRLWNRRQITHTALLTALFLISLAMLWRRPAALAPLRVDQVTRDSPVSAGPPGMENLLTLATDGQRIFAPVLWNGKPQLAAIDISTGEMQPLIIPTELASARVADISRDGSHLLLRSQLSLQSEQPLWIVSTAGGALRVGSIQAHDATWMPDGGSILFANGNELKQVRLDGGSVTLIAKLTGRAFWLRWSPDGSLLRFTVMDPLTHTGSLWELKRGSGTPRPLLKNRISQVLDCCGNWTPDGKAYIFQVSDNSGSNLWELKGSGVRSALIQLTNGPLSFFSPVAARSGQRIYFYGSDQPSGLQRYDGEQRGFRPERSFLADANRVVYSHDRKWVAWEDFSRRLWRARAADGSDKIQLTPNDLEVFSAQWSPDDRNLTIMARRSAETWQIYLISTGGGTPQPLVKDDRNVADPDWSADGKEIVFGREPDSMGKESGPNTIQLFNLQSQMRTTLPQSEGLFSPRWSPDGKWIAALTMAQDKVMLFDVVNQRWRELASTSAADPTWSSDSKAVFVHAFMAENQPIVKISVPSGEVKLVASSADFHSAEPSDYFFGGLTPEDLPLVRPRVGTGNLFTMDIDRR
jgi:Tol biopolymer transport system component/DNA-binding winged helix-turn-helix (wHTH) protein